ncbi:EmrB/QacA subfamily drug resistance transporter [Arthrobacter sp. B1I2]|nr:EmrB/QacA subfamily drug resistance transporter [Arthrobacter sp. B1I2]
MKPIDVMTPGNRPKKPRAHATKHKKGSSTGSILRTLTGLLTGLLVALLASSIISTSIPRIVNDLAGSQATFTWIVTATLLAITISTPIWGKLADLLNRKALVQAALVIFIAGSLLAGAAPEPGTLIAGRVIQGLGAGGLLTLVQIIMADIISPRDRGKYMGLTGAVMTAGSVGGPLLGGVITDFAGWRWNFFASVPFALASLVLIQLTLHLPRKPRTVTIDYAGAVFITAGVSSLLIWITLGGSQFEWRSLQSLLLLAASLVLLIAAVLIERKAAEPIIPLSLFRNRSFSLTVIASISVGVAVYGTAVFMSQYLQLSRAATATDSGLIAMPQVIAVVVASTVVGALISRSGKWKFWMVLGASFLTLGLGCLATIGVATPIPLLWTYMAFVGLGIGMVMQNLVLVTQNTAEVAHLGVASAGVAFFRTLGGTIGVTVLGAALSSRAAQVIADKSDSLRAQGIDPSVISTGRLPDMGSLSDPLRAVVAEAYAQGVAGVFLLSTPLALLTVVAIAFLPNVPLKRKTGLEQLAETEAEIAVDIAGGEARLAVSESEGTRELSTDSRRP